MRDDCHLWKRESKGFELSGEELRACRRPEDRTEKLNVFATLGLSR
jgi:hypothetical protein